MQGKDFYFQMQTNQDGTFFLITPKRFYDSEGCLCDESGVADEAVPPGFTESSESTYEFDGAAPIGRQRLLEFGFVEIDFGFGQEEPREESDDDYHEDEEEDNGDDRPSYYPLPGQNPQRLPATDDLDHLLGQPEAREPAKKHELDYSQMETSELLRHLNVMVRTESYREAAKIKTELDSRQPSK